MSLGSPSTARTSRNVMPTRRASIGVSDDWSEAATTACPSIRFLSDSCTAAFDPKSGRVRSSTICRADGLPWVNHHANAPSTMASKRSRPHRRTISKDYACSGLASKLFPLTSASSARAARAARSSIFCRHQAC